MAKNRSVSMNASFPSAGNGAMKKANEAGYAVKTGNDNTPLHHGSRPAQINAPGKKALKA